MPPPRFRVKRLRGLKRTVNIPKFVGGVVRVGQQRIRRIIGGAGGGVVYEGKAHARTKKPTTA
jgi:hypothetical protein